jgi:hypothetical protein
MLLPINPAPPVTIIIFIASTDRLIDERILSAAVRAF